MILEFRKIAKIIGRGIRTSKVRIVYMMLFLAARKNSLLLSLLKFSKPINCTFPGSTLWKLMIIVETAGYTKKSKNPMINGSTNT